MPPRFESPQAVIEPSALRAAKVPRFIQLGMPLLPLKPMVQSRRGVTQIRSQHQRVHLPLQNLGHPTP
jgi:hypothetical protein